MRFYEIMIILQTAPLPAPQLNNDSIKGHQIYMFPFQSRLVLFLAACPAATGPVKCRRFPSMKHPSLMKMPSHTQVTNHKRTFWKRKSRVQYLKVVLTDKSGLFIKSVFSPSVPAGVRARLCCTAETIDNMRQW